MKLQFVNREAELAELDHAARRGGLLVLFGRRRIGKTRLLRHWLNRRSGMYSQAIEATPEQQLEQIFSDIRGFLKTNIGPGNWEDLFEILALQKGPWTLCLDEFPYLAARDSSLPSRIQKWIDHTMPAKCLLILAGSSTHMMHDLFLHRSAPLYGRAQKLLQVRPMDYRAFSRACRLKPGEMETFEKFACMGGVPRYWESCEPGQNPVELAESLFFDLAAYMEYEPRRVLSDEGIGGINALAVLEAVGRGAERPSEIASRLGTPQTNLSRLLQQLLDASVLKREVPFGENARSTKRVLYRIADPALRFWFRVYSPHRSRWPSYSTAAKQKLIHEHSSSVFEDWCRERLPNAQRYWERDIELDLVAPHPDDNNRLLVAEVKWRTLTAAEKRKTRKTLEEKWSRCSLSTRYPPPDLKVVDARCLTKRI